MTSTVGVEFCNEVVRQATKGWVDQCAWLVRNCLNAERTHLAELWQSKNLAAVNALSFPV